MVITLFVIIANVGVALLLANLLSKSFYWFFFVAAINWLAAVFLRSHVYDLAKSASK